MRTLVDLSSFCSTAEVFWRTNVLPAGDRIILVEAMSQDLRVTLRNLTVANALRRIEPARLVVYSGTDEDWNEIIWTYFDLDEIRMLCDAYGASEFFDVHAAVDARVGNERSPMWVAGVDLSGELPDAGTPETILQQVVHATLCRVLRVARPRDDPAHHAKRDEVEVRSREFARIFDALISRNEVVALVSSHVDYNNFGLAVESARRNQVPVVFPQSTGGLKAYALFPEHGSAEWPVRAGLTTQIGEFFETYVWPNRELLAPGRELTAWRAKATLGRPSWWRAGRSYSSVDLRDPLDRATVRRYAGIRAGIDPAKPVVAVFAHAVSDALGTNVEAYPDLGAWLEATAEYAAARDDVSWLFLDHPQQPLYDRAGFFETCAKDYTEYPHMRFMRSMDLSKNFLIALADLVLTVRGSVSNEYPALGIPALQAGWSEWSNCGFTTVTETPTAYLTALKDHLEGLIEGRPLITPEQVERARLWTWFYRSGADVVSPLVQQWSVGEGDDLFRLLSINMLQVESDAEPAFASVRRMWKRRDPFLTRIDWRSDSETMADHLAPVGTP